jgi:hypothetical protein
VLFLEHVPQTLAAWMADQDVSAFARVDAQLADTTAFMREHGLVHFDAHFLNILTDGHVLYFSDFGLALSDRFDLSDQERAFLREHPGQNSSGSALAPGSPRAPRPTSPDPAVRAERRDQGDQSGGLQLGQDTPGPRGRRVGHRARRRTRHPHDVTVWAGDDPCVRSATLLVPPGSIALPEVPVYPGWNSRIPILGSLYCLALFYLVTFRIRGGKENANERPHTAISSAYLTAPRILSVLRRASAESDY